MPRINANTLRGFTTGATRGIEGFMSGDAAYQNGFDKQAQLQTRMAQSIAQARQADAAARYHDAQTENETTKTGILNRRPGLFEEQVAAASGTDTPMVRAIRSQLSGNPVKVPMGPPTEDGQMGESNMPLDPDKVASVTRAIQQFLPLLSNAGDLKPDDLSKAASDYRNMGLSDAIIAGTQDRNKVGGAQAAVAGKPIYNADSTGAVLDQYGGTLDTGNPMAGSTISLRKEQAGQAKAGAAEHYAGAGEKQAQTAKIQQETTQGSKGRYDPASGMIIDERAGTARPVLGPDGKPMATPDKGMTDSQAKANLFGSRMAEADRILTELDGKYSPAAVKAKMAAGDLPLVGGLAGAIGNSMLSEAGQRVEQAQRDFINAVLRRESGAVISPGEFANANLQYFPQPQDKPETLRQKARNRKMAIDGMLAEVPASKRGIAPGVSAPGGVRNIQVDY